MNEQENFTNDKKGQPFFIYDSRLTHIDDLKNVQREDPMIVYRDVSPSLSMVIIVSLIISLVSLAVSVLILFSL